MMNDLKVEETNLLQKIKREPELRPYFFKKIKNIKWFLALEKEGLFSSNEMPTIRQNMDGSYRFPQWPAIEYLVKASDYLSSNQDLIPNFLFIIKQCTEEDFRNQYHNSYLLWGFAKIYRNIPFNLLSLDDVSIVDMWFSDVHNHDLVSDEVANILLTVLDNIDSQDYKNNVLRLLSILFQVNKVDPKSGRRTEVSINFKSHRKDELVTSIGQKVGSVLGNEGIDNLFKSLSKAVEIIATDDYSRIWRSAVEEHHQNSSYREEEDLLIVACREALAGYGNVSDSAQLCGVLNALLGHQFSIVKRIAIHSYNYHFDKVGNILMDDLLKPEFFRPNFRHELWHLFNNNYEQFSETHKEKLYCLIETQSLRDDGTPSYYYQAEWLLAICDYNDTAKEKLNFAIEKLNGNVPEHPDFTSYTSSRSFGTGESPIPLAQLKETASRSTEELIDLLNNYRSSGSPLDPGIEELVRCFKQFVLDESDKVHCELCKYEKLKVSFIYEIIQAYMEIWKTPNKPQPNWKSVWPSLMQFINNILTNKGFWIDDKDNVDEFIGRKSWIVSSVCKLIESGCKNDEHAFDIENIELAKDILKNILRNQKGEEFSPDTDAVSVSINSNRGQCLEALINLALFECRFSNRQNEEHQSVWKEYSSLFNTELNEVKSLEFRTLLPMYVGNFKWLSHDWFEQNFNAFFTDELDLACICSLQGYAHTNYLDPLMYEYLRRADIFEKILDHELLGIKIERRYITFGLIPYILKDEPLSDESSLIYKLLQRNKPDEFKEIISLFRHAFSQHKNINTKAIELFPIILKSFNDENLESKKVLSHLVDWAKFLDFNNDMHIDWLANIAPFAELDHNAHDFIKVIEKISEVDSNNALKVWMSLLTSSPGYPYPEESYIRLFKNLLISGLVREAKIIADTYIKYGLQSPADWFRIAKDSVEHV
jgi:hypothetical protein